MNVRYQQITNEVIQLQANLEEEEKKIIKAENIVKNLESDMMHVRAITRDFKISEIDASKKAHDFSSRCSEMLQHYKESEGDAIKFEKQVTKKELIFSKLESNLAEEGNIYQREKADMDNLLIEIHDSNI